jgi:hypothetical protein
MSADQALQLLDLAANGESLSKTDATAAAKFVKGLLALAFSQRVTEDKTADNMALQKLLPSLGVEKGMIPRMLKALNSLEAGNTGGVNKQILQKISDLTQELLRAAIGDRSILSKLKNPNKGLS